MVDSHSPLPWRIGYSDGSGHPDEDHGPYSIQTMAGEYVVQSAEGERSWFGVLDPDDAKLIIEAVNSYHSLIAERDRYRKELEFIRDECNDAAPPNYSTLAMYAIRALSNDGGEDE